MTSRTPDRCERIGTTSHEGQVASGMVPRLVALAVLAGVHLAASGALGQSVSGTRGVARVRTWTWADAVAFDTALPPPLPKKPGTASPNVFPPPKQPVVPRRDGVTPEELDPIARGVPAGPDGPCGAFVGTSVGVQFEALADNVTSIPPDTMGAIGPRHAMTMLNTQVRIQDRGGIGDFSTVALGAFWPDLSNPFDPKVFYDRLSQRWIAVCPGSAQSAASEWSIAVSLTDDPTGGWGWITLDADAGNTRWADYPCVGFNDKWIVVTFNMFAVPGAPMPGPTGPKMWVIDKADLLGPGPNVGYTEFDVGFIAGGTSLQPAVCLDSNVPDVLIVDTASFIDPVDQFPLIRMSRVTGPTGSPSWQAIPGSPYTTPGVFKAPHRYTTELRTAAQHNSPTPIEVGNARACNAVFRGGRLYFSHSGGGFFGGFPTNETLIYWYALQPTLPGPIVNWGYFGEGTGKAVFYPSIAVNCHGDIGIGYSRSHAAINVSTGFAFIPAGTAGAALYDLAAGGAPYVRLDGSGRNRWGDYSATVVDPRDDMSFWTIQESAAATANRWTTRWTQFPHNCSGAPVIFSQPQNASACPGGILTLSLNASGTGNSYQWFRDGSQIPGALGPTLLISNATASHSGTYHATVTNNCGVTRSADALVRVGVAITSQPANTTPSACDTVSLSVGVAFPVGTIAYRWHKEFAPLGINIPLDDDGHFSGVHTSTLTIHGVGYADEGRYTCRVFDPSCANVEVYSTYARLAIPAPTWTHRTSSGPRRRLPTSTDMVYDAARGVCVLYGGSFDTTTASYMNDTWEWDGHSWTQRFPANNPGHRTNHEMVYDSLRNKVLLLFGSSIASPYNPGVWQYDGTDWTLLTNAPGGPPFAWQQYGEAAFDPLRGKVIATDASSGGSTVCDTWEFDPVTLVWVRTVTSSAPAYSNHHAAWDASLGAVLSPNFWPSPGGGTLRYTGATWMPQGADPPRHMPAIAFDTFRNRMTMFGCCRDHSNYWIYRTDTYAFDGAVWQLLLPEFHETQASALRPVAMCFDTRRNAMVVIGNSHNSFVGENPVDTWEYRYADKVAIDRQPQDQPLIIGGSATFRVYAAGAGTLTHQWRKNGAPLADGPTPGGSIISGAQTSTLTITNVAASDAGAYSCLVANSCGPRLSDAANLGTVCYANCDGSTAPPVLNVNDFTCFLNKYAAGDPSANCDGSTAPPVLNVNDFLCFINGFAAGCP
ncbi:MAG: immunoglobulin domain-containing protein [Phycisphaerae bacterium]|nr:immunoglobulin domain-containing protein [Phycisphaerae bacterium]